MLSTGSVACPGGTFSYLAAGDPGAPLVLCLHGFPDHPRSFEDVLVRLAAAGYRAVAPWMRGYAPSVLDGPYHVDRLARDAVELAAALSPGRPARLVGHDWGAVATYGALAAAPGAFSHAVALSVPHPIAFLRGLTRHPRQLRRSWYMLFFQLGPLADRAVAARDFALIDWLWRDWSPSLRAPAPLLHEIKDTLRQSMPAPVAYYRAMFRTRPSRLRQAARERITTPTLHLYGDEDGGIGPELSRGQERFFAGRFESVCLPGAGHFLPLERPRDVAERTIAWFATPS